MTYYDRAADVLLIEVSDGPVDRSVEHEWGLVDESDDGQTVAIELWQASTRLPAGVLDALPAPPPQLTAAGRRSA